MSSSHAAAPDEGFQNRLTRVAERRAPHEAARPMVDVLPDWRANIREPMGMALALASGLVAVFVVRVIGYHAFGTAMIGDHPDLIMAAETVAALALAVAVFLLSPFRGYKFHLLQFAGVALMITTMHNMVHSAPGLFSLAFSPDWTEEVTGTTDPGSLYLRGQSLPFTTPADDPAPAAPAATASAADLAAPVAPAAATATTAPDDPAAAPAEDAKPELPKVLRLNSKKKKR